MRAWTAERRGGAAAALALTLAAAISRRARRREASARRRAALLADAGELLDRSDPIGELDALARIAVPELADLSVIDLREDDRLRLAAVAAADPVLARRLRELRGELSTEVAHPAAVALRTGEPQLIARLRDEDLRRWAPNEAYLRLMRETGYRSAIVVPLTARGESVGALGWVRLRGSPPYREGDVELAREFARRAGLAVDHARLFGALTETEAELRAVVGALAEAVTVQGPDGEIVYANRAAAELLGLPDERTLIARGTARAWEGFDVRDARGDSVEPARLPGRQALAGVPAPEPLLLRVTERATGEVKWRLVKASPVLGADGRPRLAVNVIEDVTEAHRSELKQRFLAQATKLLSSSLDTAVTLEKVAWAAVPELADWCAVDMPDARGRLRRVATADVEQRRRGLDRLVVGGGAGGGELPVGPPHVLATGRSELYHHIDDALLRAAARDSAQLDALRRVGALSALVVPLVAGDRIIGTITLGTTRDSGRRLNETDLELAEELARRAGVAIENARVHGERVQIATTLQEALLPPRLPEIPGVSIAARFRAAGEASHVGGDFYDVFAVPGGWMAIIGDVTGKGAPAAAVTALARHTMRTAAQYEPSPARVLARLNEAILEAERSQLCTAACVRLAPVLGGRLQVTVACAGHPAPLLVRGSGEVVAVESAGTLLGAFARGAWDDTLLPLEAGDSLVLYTDGVTDTGGEHERFGAERLEALLAAAAGSDADALAARIDGALRDFQSGDQRDDMALLVLQASGGAAGAASEAALLGEARS
ncbi:MAG TPA: SpoIIE family protein phosphatase [Solirubrobacteraceae bacterium]